jgi:hypothetical protein
VGEILKKAGISHPNVISCHVGASKTINQRENRVFQQASGGVLLRDKRVNS